MTPVDTRMVVTGGAGIFARALAREFPNACYVGKATLDVGDPDSVWRFLARHQPDVIVHAGAVTRYDAPAEDLIRVNVVGTNHVAEYARAHGAYLVYLSTDYVYPGTAGYYTEWDRCAPVNAYAWSKYAGEFHVATVGLHLIVRGSWYGSLYWRRAATDVYTSRIPVEEAAGMVARLIRAGARGVVNIGGPRRSLYEVARSASLASPVLPTIGAAVAGLPYVLPYDTSLDTSRLQSLLADVDRRSTTTHAM